MKHRKISVKRKKGKVMKSAPTAILSLNLFIDKTFTEAIK